MNIPASQYVTVTPGVISAGGSALTLSGMVLTENTRVPLGSVPSFPNATAVSNYFGPGAAETAFANIYFGGFLNSNVKPAALLFYQYNAAAVSAYTRGTSVASLSLAQLQAISGTLSVTIDGTVKSDASLNLSAATSFSNAASIIGIGLGLAGGQTCTYDSVSGAFVITSGTTGTSSTINVPTGTTAAALGFTGAVTSQGAVATTPSAAMTAITQITQNWATFTTMFDPDGGSGNTQKLLFAAWAAGSVDANNFAYICWDVDQTPQNTVPATSSMGYILETLDNSSGTCLISSVDYTIAAFAMGAAASIDYTETNGDITFAYKQSPSPMNGEITSQTIASNLVANGYNYYGVVATAAQGFTFFYPGSITGEFEWLDDYVNQIWLNNAFQLALMELLVNTKSIPYREPGYALVHAACMDPINQGLNFGMFGPGETLSAAQIAEVNNAAGLAIDATLVAEGYYLQILDAPAQTRGARTTPPMTFWYLTGGSIQSMNLASIEVA